MADEKIDYTHFKVRVFAHNAFFRSCCLLCHGEIGKDGVSAVLEAYTEDRQKKEVLGDICRECLNVGPEGAAARMKDQARRLQNHAKWLEQLAGAVVQAVPWATGDDLVRARVKLDKKMGWDKEEIKPPKYSPEEYSRLSEGEITF